MSSLLRVSRLKALVAAPLSAIFLQALSMSAHADVQVSGKAEAITIEANDASLEEVLAALGTNCGLQYRYPADFNHSFSGTFAGSLPQVLSRLLQGYNFVVKSSESGTSVVIYDLNAGNGGGIDTTRNSLSQPPANPLRPALRPNYGQSGLPPAPGRDWRRAARARRSSIGQ
jgi:type II secretory pathway component GspD/PulD (secretin)